MATEAAQTEAAAHGAEQAVGMPQLDFATFPNQIFWLVVTLVALYFIIARLAVPRISSVLEDRHSTIQNDLDRAAQLKQDAVEAEVAYKAALAEARSEAMRIAGEAKAAVQAQLDVAIAKADAEISAKSTESESRIRDIRDSALQSISEVANATTGEIIAAILPGTGDEASIKSAIEARLKG
ncbi:MAG TPA: F0F1 ATP synthase subunit B' [Paracoccaceae bacterium]|nr:F0F1 ATP synthase subunit B' [Paracoccaceae bacterium]